MRDLDIRTAVNMDYFAFKRNETRERERERESDGENDRIRRRKKIAEQK